MTSRNLIIESLDDCGGLDEKLKVLAPGVTASGETHDGSHVDRTYNGPSRMGDEHKDTEFGKSHRKDAADKIKAHRAETGQSGTKPFKHGQAGFAVYREGTHRNYILEFLDTNGDFGGNEKHRYHKAKQSEHESKEQEHKAKSSHITDDHMMTARYHRFAASAHALAASNHKHDSPRKNERSERAESKSALANNSSAKIAKGEKLTYSSAD